MHYVNYTIYAGRINLTGLEHLIGIGLIIIILLFAADIGIWEGVIIVRWGIIECEDLICNLLIVAISYYLFELNIELII